MCDVFEAKCEGCGLLIPIHIGDFSTGRRNVRVWCPQGDCRDKMIDWLKGVAYARPSGLAQWFLFVEWVPECDADAGVLPGMYTFIVDVPRCVHVN